MSALGDVLAQYTTLVSSLRRLKRIVLANPYSDEAASLGILADKADRETRKQALAAHFDGVESSVFELFLLRLVAAFESEAFRRIATSIGEARKTLETAHPERASIPRLVKTREDVFDLRGIEALMVGANADTLAGLREHRNHVAHGGRVGKQSAFSNVDEIHDALEALLKTL